MRKTHGVLGNLLGTTYQQNDLGSQQGTDRAALENHVSDPRLTRFQPSTAVMARNLSSLITAANGLNVDSFTIGTEKLQKKSRGGSGGAETAAAFSRGTSKNAAIAV
ncbi:hypothetical protein E4U54_005949 [Claviceps lovelessii]|nr:hypothetical protein E4U54_005949 [Claviceps lovelessii]